MKKETESLSAASSNQNQDAATGDVAEKEEKNDREDNESEGENPSSKETDARVALINALNALTPCRDSSWEEIIPENIGIRALVAYGVCALLEMPRETLQGLAGRPAGAVMEERNKFIIGFAKDHDSAIRRVDAAILESKDALKQIEELKTELDTTVRQSLEAQKEATKRERDALMSQIKTLEERIKELKEKNLALEKHLAETATAQKTKSEPDASSKRHFFFQNRRNASVEKEKESRLEKVERFQETLLSNEELTDAQRKFLLRRAADGANLDTLCRVANLPFRDEEELEMLVKLYEKAENKCT